MVGVNEFYTSKKCPTCEEFIGQVDMRRFYCFSCKTYMHRDVMTGHNMVNIVRSHLLTQQRSRYLQPRDIDGNYPWKESRISGNSKSHQGNYNGVKRASVGPFLDYDGAEEQDRTSSLPRCLTGPASSVQP